MTEENKTIPRICLSHNVLGCVNALSAFSCEDYEKNWDESAQAFKAILYSIDAKDIPPSALVDSCELYERELVPDAIITQECWSLSPITMKGVPVNILDSSGPIRFMYCAKEKNRDAIYSVIDSLYNHFATKNKDNLDKLSLFYIMNYYFYNSGVEERYKIDAGELDDKLCEIANKINTPRMVDCFRICPDVYVNNVLHTLRPHGLKYKTPSIATDFTPPAKPSLSDMILKASGQQAKQAPSPILPDKEPVR